MLRTKSGSRLVQLIAIEENYPLVGRLTLERAGLVERTTARPSLGPGKIWIDPDVRDSLGLRVGDRAKLGEREFEVTDVVTDDTSDAWRGFDLAPKITLRVDDLFKTGLIRKGSTLWDRTYVVVKRGVRPADEARKWNATTDDTAFRATPAEEASERIAKLSSRLNDYLGLVGITTLFLALIGIAFLFQTELRRRVRMIGTLRALGDSNRRITAEIAIEALVLGALAGALSIAVVHFTLPFAARAVADSAGAAIHPQVAPLSALASVLIGAFIGFFIAFPFANRIGRLKPSALFQDEANLEIPSRLRDEVRFAPLLLLFYGLAVYHAHSWRVGSVFFGLAFASVLALLAIGHFFFGRLERFRVRGLPLRIALRSLARNPWSALSGFLAVGLGAMLLSLIPDLQGIIETEIERPEGSTVPSLFLFDIQEEQVAGLEKTIAEHGGRFEFRTPLIRARLETLRGKPVEKAIDFAERSTREQEEEERSRNRGFNLTYRDRLLDSEKIAKGRDFSGRYDPASGKLPEVTLERQYADRLGVGVGDRVGFDVQGIPIEAEIVGLRRVRWSSFQPNFFIVFQAGVLEDAPKTFLGGVPRVDPGTRREIQEAVVAKYPNIAIIQVEAMVRKILKVFDQMAVAIRLTAMLSLVTGVFVLFSIARRQAALRRRSALLLRAVGASARDVLAIFLWEFGVLSVVASAFGVLFSLTIARVLAWFLFDRAEFAVRPISLGVVIGVSMIALASAALAALGLVREKPWRLLQAEGER
jgi:putative ABC transport system permease protein